ncbi:MAG: hypothetical protein ABW072_01580 [Sedimenticola sp.]
MVKEKEQGTMSMPPDLSKVSRWPEYLAAEKENIAEMDSMYQEAREFLEFYEWCLGIEESYVGMIYPGIVAVFLFRITPSKEDVDEWIWVIVGDLPPTYLTTDECPNPATALDGYIGAMLEWVYAAQKDESVAELIPVNVPATKEHAAMLKTRLDFLDERILSDYRDDLRARR